MDDNASHNIKETENIAKEKEKESYLGQLSDKEKIALETAKNVLGSSFNLNKSIGFIDRVKMANI
jgi:hypothetical protein